MIKFGEIKLLPKAIITSIQENVCDLDQHFYSNF